MLLNRKIQPEVIEIDTINPIEYSTVTLDNGIPVFLINSGTQELLKVELILKAGSWYQKYPFIAHSANTLLIEGTQNYTADQLSNLIDYYGAFFENQSDRDNAYITLFTLNKYIDQTLPLLEEITKRPVFPESEFDIYLKNKIQEFEVNNKKVNYLAKNTFPEMLYGKTHPYGMKLEKEVFNTINVQDIRDFYTNQYTPGNCWILVAGKIEPDFVSKLNKHLGGKDWANSYTKTIDNQIITPSNSNNFFIEKDDAVQSAIRIGKRLFNRTHEDYQGMMVVNTILGGYFGSRLMSNIREDKGYTYGIGSGLASFLNDGYFFISTEVGTEVTNAALDEIYAEIKLLQNELVDNEELDLVKNYLTGNLLRSLDGPFAMAERFRIIREYDLSDNYLQFTLDKIRKIQPEEIIRLSQKYLNINSMSQLVVGKQDNVHKTK